MENAAFAAALGARMCFGTFFILRRPAEHKLHTNSILSCYDSVRVEIPLYVYVERDRFVGNRRIDMYRILVVEDDEDIRDILKNYLENDGYYVDFAADGVEGVSKFHAGTYDLILLDVMLPKIDGFGVCELIRKESDVPVIMLTALEEEEYQIRGLDLRADDYITKPFSVPVLLRKIAAILRRVYNRDGKIRESESDNWETGRSVRVPWDEMPGEGWIIYGRLQIDLDGCIVYVVSKDGREREEVGLTQKEYDLLCELLINRGIVLTRQKLLNLVWGEDYFGEERIVDTHIKNIRKKLGCDYIRTIRGVGYRIDREAR